MAHPDGNLLLDCIAVVLGCGAVAAIFAAVAPQPYMVNCEFSCIRAMCPVLEGGYVNVLYFNLASTSNAAGQHLPAQLLAKQGF